MAETGEPFAARRFRCRWRPRRRPDGWAGGQGAGHRPVEIAAERPERQRRRLGRRRAGREVAQRRLQLLLRRLKLADQLRVQIAPGVDVADECAARLRRRARAAACARSASASSVLEPPAALFEGRARPLQLVERALTCDDAIGVELRERAQDARRLPDLPDVGGGQQQPQVAALAELVDVDEPGRSSGRLAASCCSRSCIR